MRIIDIISTQVLSLTTTPIDLASLVPGKPGIWEGILVLFHGNNSVDCRIGNEDGTKYLPIPTNTMIEYSIISRDRFVGLGLMHVRAVSGSTDCTITVCLVEGS